MSRPQGWDSEGILVDIPEDLYLHYSGWEHYTRIVRTQTDPSRPASEPSLPILYSVSHCKIKVQLLFIENCIYTDLTTSPE